MGRDDMTTDERSVGFGDGHLRPTRNVALIVVDMMAGYLERNGPFYHSSYTPLALRMEESLAKWRSREFPVIFTRVSYPRGLEDAGVFGEKVPGLASFTEGLTHGEFISSISPRDADLVITKKYASSFFGTTLSTDLHCMGVDTVVVTGVSTSGCVRATVVDAIQYGFTPIVASDLVGDRSESIQSANLFDLGLKYADVLEFSQVLDLLDRL